MNTDTPPSKLSWRFYIALFGLMLVISKSVAADTVTTSFEFNAAGTFDIGTTPITASFQNGTAESRGIPAFYTSGAFSWHVASGQTGVITFETPAEDVELFFIGNNSEVRIFDEDGFELASFSGSPSFVTVQHSRSPTQTLISRIEVDNTGGVGDLALDDFTFTAEVPADGSLIPEPIKTGELEIQLTEVAADFVAPVFGISSPVDSSTLFVVDQTGQIYAVDLATGNKTTFLDVSARLPALGIGGPGTFDERGLLGLAFHTDYAANGLIYTYTSEPVAGAADFTTSPATTDHQSVILEWQVPTPADPSSVVDTGSVREIMRIDQPQFNHNAGALAFDANGYLYIALGDGGGADDEGDGHGANGNGRDATNVLGSILRINPLGNNSANGQYGIPASNPFVGGPEVDEIFAFGLRNPFRMSYDSATGLWVGDVGQNDIEEIDVITAGSNYGWNHKEGSFFFDGNGGGDGFATATDPGVPAGLADPVAEYDHDEGIAIIGGFVYRGSDLPDALDGSFIFGDFAGGGTSGRLFYLNDSNVIREFKLAGQDSFGLLLNGFGMDGEGELYALANTTGTPSGSTGVVMKLDPVPGANPPGGANPPATPANPPGDDDDD
ncbi:MAG: PQQ-dependent sugar dehydrogenase, partial [Gammaproteobacteria bacterium]|nr:PQQ-dependent sugar dehydrogenase [Gammaproteobacteria bacterium]